MKKMTFFAGLLFLFLLLSGCMILPAEDPAPSSGDKPVMEFMPLTTTRTLKGLCMECVTIVRGVTTRTDPSRPLDTTICTDYYITVSECFKGNAVVGSEVTFWEIGGETDELILRPSQGSMTPLNQEGFYFILPDGSHFSGFYFTEDREILLMPWMAPELFSNTDAAYMLVSETEFSDLLHNYLNK